jgi:hypothetical protein
MSKRMMFKVSPPNPELERLLKESKKRVANMTPEERRAMYRAQAISFAYGNLNISRLERGLPEIPREEFERAFDERH